MFLFKLTIVFGIFSRDEPPREAKARISTFLCSVRRITGKSTHSSFSIIHFLPNLALTEQSKIINCPQWGMNAGPLDHHSNALPTDLSHYLVVCESIKPL